MNQTNALNEGSLVIIDTLQAGTVSGLSGPTAEVLLANGDIWNGPAHSLTPATAEMAMAAPLNVDRFTDREKAARANHTKSKNSKKNTKWADSKEFDSEDDSED